MLVVAIALGFLYRIIMPVERYMDESEYQMRVFTEFETDVYASPDPDAPVFGTFEGGSVLYVIGADTASASPRYLVRPFTVSGLDSVWIDAGAVTEYTKEEYRRWQYEEEIRKYGFDEDGEEGDDLNGHAGGEEVRGDGYADGQVEGEGQVEVKKKVQDGE
ncbi:MAG: hypothetical protein ACO363_00675 [Balneolaceae bacterium]